MSAHTGVPTREPTDLSPTERDEGLPPAQLKRLTYGLTEHLLVDTVTPETDETGLVHVYSEKGKQYTVDLETGACSCPDFEYNHDGTDEFRCKHSYRAQVATGRRGLPEWADGDAVDRMLRKRLDADREARDGV